MAVRLEREQQAQSVSNDQQYGQCDAELVGQRGTRHQVGFGDRRRTHERNRGQKEQTGIQTGASAVVLLDVVLEAAEKKGCSEQEKHVGHNSAGYGALHQRIFPGTERRRCNDQFRQIAQRRVEQSADRVAGHFRHRFGRVTKQGSKRHDRQY
jgi:hypothetical protein